MRLRLSDAATPSVLAEHYRAQAEMCHQMARMSVSPFKEGWLELALALHLKTREVKVSFLFLFSGSPENKGCFDCGKQPGMLSLPSNPATVRLRCLEVYQRDRRRCNGHHDQ